MDEVEVCVHGRVGKKEQESGEAESRWAGRGTSAHIARWARLVSHRVGPTTGLHLELSASLRPQGAKASFRKRVLQGPPFEKSVLGQQLTPAA